MIKKNSILDAWITIEQLSEGSISLNSGEFKILEPQEDYSLFFRNFISINRGKSDSGLALYCSIFPSQEILSILAEVYELKINYNEIDMSSYKFSIALYFDENMQLISDKTFCTISGYVYKERKLPDKPQAFFNEEERASKQISQWFESGTNEGLNILFARYGIKNIRYQYLSTVNDESVNIHSFFIQDLEKAKKINNNKLLNSYLGNCSQKLNLDSNKDSNRFHPSLIDDILQPKYYPLGRFPSNTNFALSLMQQVSVNLAISNNNPTISVNGPPGTGKTTLLKDIFADLIVQQAFNICKLSNKKITGEVVYNQNYKLGFLPSNISDKNIVVASSNNGAVQNIVNELPKKSEIDEDLLQLLVDTDYFYELSNSDLEVKWNNSQSSLVQTSKTSYDYWGIFSFEGGRASNVQKLLNTLQAIYYEYSKEEYNDYSKSYDDFLTLYYDLDKARNEAQEYKEKLDELEQLKQSYEKKRKLFFYNEKKYFNDLSALKSRKGKKIKQLKRDIEEKEDELRNNKKQRNILEEETHSEERRYKQLLLEKPPFFWFLKLIGSPRVLNYLDAISTINKLLDDLKSKKAQKDHEINNIADILVRNEKIIKSLRNNIEKEEQRIEQWRTETKAELKQLELEIHELNKITNYSDREKLDFSKSYSDLQKSSPWFDKSFREQQSKLFILALAVKKQFLYENKNHLLGAKIIWQKLQEYKEKEQGDVLITQSWQWINFAIPIISTTLASLGNMFKYLHEGSIGNLFIDEAGQATPQSLVGGCIKSNRIIAVGDPSQIKPVLTLDPEILSFIGKKYETSDRFVSFDSSVQTILDLIGKYGFQKPDDSWVGIPLWVHRRCNSPMFDISNKISYDGLMVQGKSDAQGQADWYDVGGSADNKFVQTQADRLKELLSEKLKQSSIKREDIFVISPFKNVAYQLANVLKGINFTITSNGRPENVGTVHTFQGKEAKIVYFVLGADRNSTGAAAWAVQEANIMNVAATRAKEEFYIIGDKELYQSTGSAIVKETLNIIDEFSFL